MRGGYGGKGRALFRAMCAAQQRRGLRCARGRGAAHPWQIRQVRQSLQRRHRREADSASRLVAGSESERGKSRGASAAALSPRRASAAARTCSSCSRICCACMCDSTAASSAGGCTVASACSGGHAGAEAGGAASAAGGPPLLDASSVFIIQPLKGGGG